MPRHKGAAKLSQANPDGEVKLKMDAADKGRCAKNGCPKRPAAKGVEYCRDHGIEYVRSLRP
jgi:hypothetical protein